MQPYGLIGDLRLAVFFFVAPLRRFVLCAALCFFVRDKIRLMKRIVIGVLIGVFSILGAYVLYTILTTRSHSPFVEVNKVVAGLEVSIGYCSPSKKERVVFGTKDEEALQPWGQYWRLGANEATQIKLSKDVTFADKPLPAGTYVMYAIPTPEEWTIVLNSELGRWGYYEADHVLDVLKVTVPTTQVNLVEKLTIDLIDKSPETIVRIAWDTYQVEIPILPEGAVVPMDSTEAMPVQLEAL